MKIFDKMLTLWDWGAQFTSSLFGEVIETAQDLLHKLLQKFTATLF